MVFGESEQPQGFDPAVWWNGTCWTSAYAVFDLPLVTLPNGKLRPQALASMPTVNTAGTLYTFSLRRGVLFHHGREMTADDMKFSLERMINPKTAGQGASLYTTLPIPGMQQLLDGKSDTLPGIKVLDKYHVSVELEEPDNVFLDLLTLPFAAIVPRDVVEAVGSKKFNWAPIGTGPYMMTNVNQSSGLTLERNPHYWNPSLPYADVVDWHIGVDPNLSLLRIEAGEQDIMLEAIPTANYPSLAADPRMKDQVYSGLLNDTAYITLSVKHPALKKLKVRQAIAMAFDKERFVRTIDGLGRVATGGLFGPLTDYYQPTLAYSYNPSRARQLLAESGYPNGFTVDFWGRNFSPFLQEGLNLQQDLKEIGITVNLHQENNGAILSIVVTNPAGLTENEWEMEYPSGSYVMDGGFTKTALTGGCCNFSDWVSPSFDQVDAEAHLTTDFEKEVELYKEMDRIVIQEQALWVPTIYLEWAQFTSSRLRGYQIPAWGSGGVLYLRDYWLA